MLSAISLPGQRKSSPILKQCLQDRGAGSIDIYLALLVNHSVKSAGYHRLASLERVVR